MPDLGAYAQSMYDAGYPGVHLDAQQTWTLDTPLFLDKTRFGDKFEIDLNGVDVTLGANLPTVGAAFTPDPTVRVGIYANTKRTAWNRTTNTVDVKAGKATPAGATPRLHLRNGRLTAAGRNVGVAFGNRCGAILENVVVHGARFAWSWYDYADQHRIVNGHFQTAGGTAQVPDAFYLYGVAKGDGVIVDSLKCDGAVGGVSLRECFGAQLSGLVTAKTRLTRCAGIVVTAAHQEAGIYAGYSPNFEITNSDVLFLGGTFYPPREAGRATIEVTDDATGPLHSNVHMLGPGYRLLKDHAATAQAFIDVRRRNALTAVTVERASFKQSTAPGVWASCPAPVMNGVAA